MSLFENPGNYGEEPEDQDPLFPQGDPIQRAAEAQRERLKKEAEEEAEKEAKAAKKKAEKEAKLAKKLADKATDQVKDKVEKTESSSDVAKEKVAEVKEAVEQMSEQIAEVAEELTANEDGSPLEMRFTEGSEYISELKEGEEAIFDLSNEADKVEQTIELADEVTERAQALARARAALNEVVSGDMGVERDNQEVTEEVFGVTGPEQDVRDRLRSTWEHEVAPSTTESSAPEVPYGSIDTSSDLSLPAPLSSDERTSAAPWFAAGAAYGSMRSEARSPEPTPPSVAYVREEPVVEKKTNPINGAVASVAGFFAGRSQSLKEDLKQVDAELRQDVSELQASLPNVEQPQPTVMPAMQKPDLASPRYMPERKPTPHRSTMKEQKPNVERLVVPPVSVSHQEAIPAWIRQVETEVKKGKVVELKKWQRDVLKSQHPELLKRYDSVDQKEKERIKSQSFEYVTAPSVATASVPASQPGELPAPLPLFASKQPSFQPQYVPSMPVTYPSYGIVDSVRAEVTSSSYITIVSIGGILMGTILIALFGL